MALRLMPALPKALFFDLDGTLVDSVPDLAFAVDRMLEDLGLAPAGEARVRLWVGNGARKLVLRALSHACSCPEAEIEAEAWSRAHCLFLQHYGLSASQRTRVYPQVPETLQQLRSAGVRMAVITNKPQQFTPQLLDALGLAGFFELVVCGDTLPLQKPEPEPLFHAMEVMGLEAGECWMIGDSRNDIEAAAAAGVRSVCVAYGYNHGEDPARLPATCHVSAFGELMGVFNLAE